MPVDIQDLLDILETLCDDQDLKATVRESLKSGLITGGLTTVGGIVGGPAGVAVGGIVGAIGAAYYAKGKFKPVSQVLREMPKNQKQILYDRAMAIVNGLNIEDALLLSKVVLDDPGVRQEMLSVIVDHVSNQLHIQIID